MRRIFLLLFLLVSLCLAGACDSDDDDDNDNGSEESSPQLFEPLGPGEVPFVNVNGLPIPTYRPVDDTVRGVLDGRWAFKADPDGIGEQEGWQRPGFDRSDWRLIDVPGVWNAQFPELFEYDGAGWYATTFYFDGEAEMSMLRLGAVFLTCEVYLNGELLGGHTGGYTPIHLLDYGLLKPGNNTLVVKADSRITGDTIPVSTINQPGKHGWWPYGGISRSVTLHEMPRQWLFKIEPRFTGDGGEVELTLGVLAFYSDDDVEVGWTIESPAGKTYSGRFALRAPGVGIYTYRVTLDAEEPLVWSRETPENLYTLTLDAEGGDGASVEFGYRTIEVDGDDILFNGERDFWWGINRHSDYPETGSVETAETIGREVGLIKELRAGHVRPSHYPVVPALLDRLRDNGVTVLEEIPVYQLFGTQQTDAHLIEEAKLQLAEMIERDKNNPAILSWSVGNENATYLPSSHTLVTELVAEAKRLDPARPVTLVIVNLPCVVPLDFASAEADIIGINQYYGWYLGTVDEAGACMDTIHELFPGHPVVATEFGAGCLAGRHLEGEPEAEPSDDHSYAEEWQAWYLTAQLDQILARDFMSGVMPWVLADFRMGWDQTTGKPHPAYKTNLKGLVTHDRLTRKMSFDVVSQIYATGQTGE